MEQHWKHKFGHWCKPLSFSYLRCLLFPSCLSSFLFKYFSFIRAINKIFQPMQIFLSFTSSFYSLGQHRIMWTWLWHDKKSSAIRIYHEYVFPIYLKYLSVFCRKFWWFTWHVHGLFIDQCFRIDLFYNDSPLLKYSFGSS